jgi:hypothetical protein
MRKYTQVFSYRQAWRLFEAQLGLLFFLNKLLLLWAHFVLL